MIIQLDFSRCREVPLPDGTMSPVKEHAKIGVKALVEHPFFLLADEMGGMKTAQAIIAAQFLFVNNVIDRMIVFAPASVRPVWFDPELGELAKHLWFDIPAVVTEFHARNLSWKWNKDSKEPRKLQIIVTNYEFMRSKNRLEQLMPLATPRTLLVGDESSSVKNHKAEQTKAFLQIRKKCGRVVLLNGTPLANGPMDLFSQCNLMHRKILANRHEPDKQISYFQFKARYAVMGGWMQKQIIEYQNLEDLQARIKPYILRRLKKDCLDLPEALPPVALYVTLSEATWKVYKQMKNDMIAWLSDSTSSVSSQAATKTLRLAQITSGFLGGVQENIIEDAPEDLFSSGELPEKTKTFTVEEVGREKLDFLKEWNEERLKADPNFKVIVFSRFIPELTRMLKEMKPIFQNVGCMAGKPLIFKTKKEEREHALRLLNPQTTPKESVFVGGTFGTGSLGHNMTASHVMVNASSDYSPWKMEQAAARINRPGQVHVTSFFDIIATGPAGQKTIDHVIVKARRDKENINAWVASDWIKALNEE